MPWNTGDVSRHKEGLTQSQKRQWVRIANSVRRNCLDEGNSESTCDARAIRQANGTVGSNNSNNMKLNKLVNNNINYEIQEQTFNGREHIVVPVTMMVEGVHAGSHGTLFHSADELGRYPAVWNGIPVLVYHPQQNGQPISANIPEVLENERVGTVFNTHLQGSKLRAETWIDRERLYNISPDTLNRILNTEPLNVSTGVFADEDGESGEWNGKQYSSTAYNHRPDHLALLPDEEGACNLEDGCGIRANQRGEYIETNQKKWTKEEAKSWLRDNDFKISDAENQANYWSFRQTDPNQYSRFRVDKSFGPSGCLVVYGIKTENDEETTEIQTVRFYHGKSETNNQLKQNSMENQRSQEKEKLFQANLKQMQLNQKGYKEIGSQLQWKLDAMDTDMKTYYLVELYEDSFIFQIESRDGSEYYKREYQVDEENDSIEITGDPVRVRKNVEYTEVTNQNNNSNMTEQKKKANQEQNNTQGQNNSTGNCCEEKVQGLINNSQTNLTSDDKEWLNKLTENQLDKLQPVKTSQNKAGDGEQSTQNNSEGNEQTKQLTQEQVAQALQNYSKPEDFLKLLPQEIADQMRSGLKLHQNHRSTLISTITNNSSEFKEDELKGMDTEMLQKISKSVQPITDYSGMGAGGQVNSGEPKKAAPLLPPGVTDKSKSKENN